MFKLFKALSIGILVILISSCAGKDTTDVDTTPPEKPHMIKHLGDTGITHSGQNYGLDNFFDEDGFENNGIDAFNGGLNSIQISWDVLTDTDIDYVEIWRFNLYEEDDTLKIHTLSENSQNYYIDSFDDYESTPIDKNWFYFIKVFDTSANFSVSDTVCYHLIDKPVIYSPLGNTQTDNFENITFSWNEASSTVFHLLVFDEDYNLLKSFSSLDSPENVYEVNFADLDIPPSSLTNTLIWQIVGDKGSQIREVNGVSYQVYLGSESESYTIKRVK